ncbi:MAG TPA: hypothetical protein VKQ72_07950, partial [Aggregatilineales bacterium]|nr:hypothetical protein [Aggregatilineales bacterium]
ISAFVILIAGVILVSSKRTTRRYMVYRIVPLAGFFGAFGLAGLMDGPGGYFGQAGLACVQTIGIMLILHVLVGRHLREGRKQRE